MTSRRAASVVAAAVAVVLAAVVWLVFVSTFPGQRLDAAAYGGAFWARVGPWPLVDAARVLVLPLAGLGVAAAVGWLALRRLWWQAFVVLVVAAGSALSVQLLKHQLLPRPDLGFTPDANSLPSGHTAAVAVACAALVVAAPPARRGPVALAGTWVTAAVGASSVVAHQHRPSDIVAAMLVVLAWVGAGAIVTGRREPPDGDRVVVRVLLVQSAAFAVPAVATMALAVLGPGRPVGGLETFVALAGALASIVATSSAFLAAVVAVAPAAVRAPSPPATRRPGPRTAVAGGSRGPSAPV